MLFIQKKQLFYSVPKAKLSYADYFTDKRILQSKIVSVIIKNKYTENGSSPCEHGCLFFLPFPIFCTIKLNSQKSFAVLKLFNYILYCFKIIKVLHVLSLKTNKVTTHTIRKQRSRACVFYCLRVMPFNYFRRFSDIFLRISKCFTIRKLLFPNISGLDVMYWLLRNIMFGLIQSGLPHSSFELVLQGAPPV